MMDSTGSKTPLRVLVNKFVAITNTLTMELVSVPLAILKKTEFVFTIVSVNLASTLMPTLAHCKAVLVTLALRERKTTMKEMTFV